MQIYCQCFKSSFNPHKNGSALKANQFLSEITSTIGFNPHKNGSALKEILRTSCPKGFSCFNPHKNGSALKDRHWIA